MLQQTRVAAVLEHYRRFLKQFPTVGDLAAATEPSVLAQWSGLGYYRRARMLHRAAQAVVSEHRGLLPCSSEELRKLPGIGRYTANAVASIAFGEPVAVVDGNVERLLIRFFGGEISREKLWTVAQNLLDNAQPGDFNQAMMELGATVCIPGVPQCMRCPLKPFCALREIDITSKKPQVKPRFQRSAAVLLMHRANSILLRQRPHSDRLMAGMWELPESDQEPEGEPILEVKHSITTTDWKIKVFTSSGIRKGAGMRWAKLGEVSGLPLTGLTRKVLRRLQLLA